MRTGGSTADTAPLVEREAVLAELAEHLASAVRGHGRVVLLSGEAGIGKTAVVRRFAARVGDRSRVLIGRCDPLSTPRPLEPLIDVADVMGPTVRAALDVGLGGVGGANPIFRALLGELTDARTPTVLIFEDVHWADGATFDLVRYLARRVEHTRTLFILTYRDDDLGRDHPLTAVVGDLAGTRETYRCGVEALSPAAVATMATGVRIDPETVYRYTRGNPFFVTEVLSAPGDALPMTVREAVLGRMVRWPAAAQAVAEAVAVIGSPAPLRLLTDVLPDAKAVLRDEMTGGLLQLTDRSVAFRHELARMAVLDAVPAYRRIELHRRVLTVLRASGVDDDLSRLAHHAEEAYDAAAVLEYAPLTAARAAAVGAHREAAAQYGRALRHAVRAPAQRRAELLELQAYSHYLTGSVGESIVAWQEAGRVRNSLGDQVREGDDLRWASYMLWLLGRNGEGKELGLRSVQVLEQADRTPELARAYVNLAEQACYDREPHTALNYAHLAVELGEQLRDPGVVVRARFHAAIARVFWRDEGWQELEELWRIATEQGMVEYAGMFAPVMSAVGVVHRDFPRARRFDERALAYCQDLELDMFLDYLTGARALGLLHQGQWDRAADEAAAVLRSGSLPPVSRVFPLTTLGLIRARRGDPESAALLDDAAASGEWDYMIRLGAAWEARTEALWLAGEDEAAIAQADGGLAAATSDSDPWAVGGLARWILLAGGQPPPVRAAGPFALELSGEWRAAARAWEELGCPYDAALARLAGDVPALLHAKETFELLGARPAASIAGARLRAHGFRPGNRGPRPSTRANPHGLTSRQLEILDHVAQGLTDTQIAARLHLSAKTVNHHVTASLAKLGMHSRSEAIRKLAGPQ